MEPQLRIRVCRLAEKMRYHAEYAEKLKLEDASYYREDKKRKS